MCVLMLINKFPGYSDTFFGLKLPRIEKTVFERAASLNLKTASHDSVKLSDNLKYALQEW